MEEKYFCQAQGRYCEAVTAAIQAPNTWVTVRVAQTMCQANTAMGKLEIQGCALEGMTDYKPQGGNQ